MRPTQRIGRIFGIVAASLTFAGCVERRLTVTSEPEGALAYLNSQEIGRTPVTRDFIWYGDYDVQLRKAGYDTVKTSKQVIAPWWQWVPFDLFAEIYPGRLHDDRTIAFEMNQASTQPADPDAMLDRAAGMRSQLEGSANTRAPSTQAAPEPTTKPARQNATTRPSTRHARTQ